MNGPRPASRKRILVVDDSSLVRLYYRDTLEKAGFEVEQAINGIEAMEKVLVQPFDLVIVDVNMPRMDGFSFLRTLRSSPGDVATLPALVITTEAGEQDVAAARAAGANFYLVKPLSQAGSAAPCRRPLRSAAMNALHEQFIAEARELIHQATDDLIAVEREGFAPERIDRVFRAFHTLKGSAGVVDLPAMGVTLHAAEDLLAAIHAGKLEASPAIIDQALACLDQVARWVDDFEAGASLPPHAGEEARAMAGALRHLLSPTETEAPAASDREVSAPATDGAPPDWVSRLIESQRRQITGHVDDARGDLVAFSYEPDRGCFFNGDDPLQLIRQVPGLLALQVDAREPWPALAELDPFACNLRLQGIATGRHAELANIFRLVPDQVRIAAVPLAAARLDQERDAGESDTAGLVRAVIAEQRQVLRVADQGEDISGRLGAAARAAANALRYGLRPDLAEAHRTRGCGGAIRAKCGSAAVRARAGARRAGRRCASRRSRACGGFSACPGAGAGAPREPCPARAMR